MATHCESLLCHDVVKSASAYSTLAGVLASVAFLGLIFLLEGRRSRSDGAGERRIDRGVENAAVGLISAFLDLIIATFLYASLSGEDTLSQRAATLAFIAAIAMSVAFLSLLYAVAWLFDAWQLDLPGAVTRTIAGLIAPAVTFSFVAIRGLDMLSLAEGRRAAKSWVGALLLSLLVGMLAAYVLSRRLRKRRALLSQTAVRATAYTALAVGVATVIATAAVSELRVTYSLPRWSVALTMSLLFAAYLAYIQLVGVVSHGEATADRRG